jgi:heptosyltransferase-2
MRVLIIKRGALGDVVRTSYFAAALKKAHTTSVHITWLTAPSAEPLLQFNPFVDRIATSFDELRGQHYDRIYSLDDELETLQGIATLKTVRITGASLDGGRPVYTRDAAGWFDMGLLSRFGKERADQLKKENRRGHAEIFCEIFGVERVEPMFNGDPREEQWAREWLGTQYFTIAVNPFAGGRWPSKELREGELRRLISKLLEHDSPDGRPIRVLLLGAGPDRERNLVLADEIASERLWVAETDASPLRLAAVIGASDALISSDSLALHLGIAQRVPFVAFFAPTSADEIDTFGYGVKVVSTAQDYCSYKSDADNSTLTADRLLEAFDELIASKLWQACQGLKKHTTELSLHG